jgi:hypothetical protein
MVWTTLEALIDRPSNRGLDYDDGTRKPDKCETGGDGLEFQLLVDYCRPGASGLHLPDILPELRV